MLFCVPPRGRPGHRSDVRFPVLFFGVVRGCSQDDPGCSSIIPAEKKCTRPSDTKRLPEAPRGATSRRERPTAAAAAARPSRGEARSTGGSGWVALPARRPEAASNWHARSYKRAHHQFAQEALE
ncbi:unnamed protein product [Prorocentrum cordatum]|uniref:Uncharacterized protein n=1 Tax=Prorocentrum cordatum TaxID=2364126 RepID=A0ABN9VCI7_9DINO|nr:unnamed protein product [Polarella glacialis]